MIVAFSCWPYRVSIGVHLCEFAAAWLQVRLCAVAFCLLPQVLDFELQKQLVPYMKEVVPLPGALPTRQASALHCLSLCGDASKHRQCHGRGYSGNHAEIVSAVLQRAAA